MSGKNKHERYPQSRTDTLIGAGTRAEGNITFSGVLRIQGDVLGDVSCAADAQGTLVVGESGNVAGTITAPHVVVGGRISGPVHSSESIEVLQGASVAGDVDYRLLDIHAGGAVEGSLKPALHSRADLPEQEPRMHDMEPPPDGASVAPPAETASANSTAGGRRRMLGGAVALLVAMIAIVLASRERAPAAPSAGEGLSKAAAPAIESPAAQAEPLASGGQQEGAKVPAGDPSSVLPGSSTATANAAPAPATSAPEKLPEAVVAVHGVNPGKPAGVLLVIGKEPSVLFRKKRQDAGEGVRIDIGQGATESIAFAKNEIFRVASGRDITIFYQGRKVAPKTIETGAWMSFVPQSASAAGDK